MSSGFPYFLQFKSEFGNKEFMIRATVCSQSCFCWMYRASPSLAANNITNLISVLTIWWCPCVEFSRVIGKGCLLWSVCSLVRTLLAFALLHPILQGKFAYFSSYFLTSYFCIPVPYNERDIFWGWLKVPALNWRKNLGNHETENKARLITMPRRKQN